MRYFGWMAPSQDSSGKLRFRLGSPTKNIICYWEGATSKRYFSSREENFWVGDITCSPALGHCCSPTSTAKPRGVRPSLSVSPNTWPWREGKNPGCWVMNVEVSRSRNNGGCWPYLVGVPCFTSQDEFLENPRWWKLCPNSWRYKNTWHSGTGTVTELDRCAYYQAYHFKTSKQARFKRKHHTRKLKTQPSPHLMGECKLELICIEDDVTWCAYLFRNAIAPEKWWG